MWALAEAGTAFREATDAERVPGIVAVAATADGVVHEFAAGSRRLGSAAPMTVDSVFWIASMTKAITTVAAMQLVEEGKLALDEPIGALLPELAARPVLDGIDAAGRARLRPAKRPITLRRLMTHTAGFGYNMWNADLERHMRREGIPGASSCLDKALTIPLSSDPGERWEYGINIDFVGKAVEAASSQALDAYFHERILGPLGMTDTAFRIGPDQRRRLVSIHRRDADGALAPIPFEVNQEPDFYMGGGGLYGTARDYIRFIRMLLNGGALDGARILRPETVALMAQNQIGALNVRSMKSAMPAVTNDVDLFPGQVEKWGLGFLINTERTPEGRSPGSLAWAGLANTYYWLDPTEKVGGVFMTHLFPFADAEALKLFGAFERDVYRTLARHALA